MHTFQLAIGTKTANKNTPTNGPVVAELVNIAVSITPDKNPTQNAKPNMMHAYMTPMYLMKCNCFLSTTSRNRGNCDRKSSQVTVARELMFETFKLKLFN